MLGKYANTFLHVYKFIFIEMALFFQIGGWTDTKNSKQEKDRVYALLGTRGQRQLQVWQTSQRLRGCCRKLLYKV